MLRSIISFESRLLIRDGVALPAILLFLIMVAYAGHVGSGIIAETKAVQQSHQERYTERIAGMRQDAVELEQEMTRDGTSLETFTMGVRHPYAVGTAQGQVVLLEPGPLAAFSVGQMDMQPPAFSVRMAGARPLGDTATLENPFKLLVGHFDLTFVFLFMFPLLILGLTFGLTSSERESGLLRMLLTQPVSLTRVVMGKLIVRGLILLACMLIGTAAVLVASGGETSAIRWFLWLLVAVIYGGFWFALSIFVDSRVKRPAVGALVLASCWLVLAIVIPSVVSTIAGSVYPVPSRMEYVTAMRSESSVAEQQGAASLARFFEDHPELAATDVETADYAMIRVARDERVANALAPLEERFRAQRDKQQRFIKALGFLSPTILTQQALLDISGTGHARYADFESQVDQFHEQWKDHFVPKYFDNVAFRPADYDAIPQFSYEEEGLTDVSRRIAAPVAAILLAIGILWLAGFRRLSKTSDVSL